MNVHIQTQSGALCTSKNDNVLDPAIDLNDKNICVNCLRKLAYGKIDDETIKAYETFKNSVLHSYNEGYNIDLLKPLILKELF